MNLVPERFEILEEIARTELEVLLRARDRILLREVVLKHPGRGASWQDPSDLARSLREARSLARVHHPGVIRLLDVIETKVGPLLVMEPIAGETLAERLHERGPLAPGEVRELGIRLAQALAAVHAEGIVHRGVSTANVLLRASGAPCLTGFVFAKFECSTQTSLHTTFVYRPGNDVLPTCLPPNPAPEQVEGHVADARSDVFGLGWVLYESLTGEPPYPRELDPQLWPKAKDPRTIVPETPRALADAILRALQPKPMKRFASAAELLAALEASPASEPSAAGARSRSRVPIAAGAAVLALALVAGGIAYLAPGETEAGATAEELRGRAVDASPSGHQPRYERSQALLIGIGGAYAHSSGFAPLANAERDVDALAQCLAAMPWEGWQVERLVGEHATRDGILRALGDLAQRTGTDDRAFVYYAGHGEPSVSEKFGWLIPADAKSAAADPGRSSWVSFSDLDRFLDEARAKHVLIAMDCCYGGRLGQTRSSTARTYEEKYLMRKARVVLASSHPNERVSDGVPGENSPFATALLDALSTPQEAAITTSWIFARIQERFAKDGLGQTPQLVCPTDYPNGEVVFFPRQP